LFAQDFTNKGEHMVKKFLALVILAVSTFVFLPSESRAETFGEKSVTVSELSVAPLFQRGRGNRGRNRNWRAWRRGNNRYNNQNTRRRARFIRQTYYRNGRRYVRVVRVY
jgi:hypothetical protein